MPASAQTGGAQTGGSAIVLPTLAGQRVVVIFTHLHDRRGTVLACLTDDPKVFPGCKGDARKISVPADGPARVVFEDVPPGRYAISLLHDENDNGRADMALGFLPREGYGFSRDARSALGPPKFRSAAFDVGNRPVQQTIRMRYMF